MTELRRVLTLRDVVLFNLVAVVSLRWMATSARAGSAALVLWVLATLLFFVPQGLAVAELARRHPDEGGIYAWTKSALGDGHGFLCGWCYWISNALYYPNLLMSMAVIATYAFGQGETGLASRWIYVLPVTLGALWFAVAINIVGARTGRWLQNIGGIGTLIPALLLIVVGAAAMFSGRPSANAMTGSALVPDLTDLSSLNLWASIAFAYGGLELSASMAGEVERPDRTLQRAVFVSAPICALLYLLGTAAMLWVLPSSDVSIVAGLPQAITRGIRDIAPGLIWLVPLTALFIAVGQIGGVGAWLTGPARIAFVIGLDRYFPPAFGRLHPRWGTPYVAILVQAGLATVALLLSVLGKGTSVETVYLIMLDMQLLLYFIPFVYLFVSLVIHRRRDRAAGLTTKTADAWILAAAGAFVTIFAMVIAMIPPSGETHRALFFAKVLGGALLFIGLGAVLYWRGQRNS